MVLLRGLSLYTARLGQEESNTGKYLKYRTNPLFGGLGLNSARLGPLITGFCLNLKVFTHLIVPKESRDLARSD